MAINVALLTSGLTNGTLTSTATASVTPTDGRPVWLATQIRRTEAATEPVTPTITGCGLTWTEVTSSYYDAATTTGKMWLFHGYTAAGATAGQITINFGATGTHQECLWVVAEGTEVANPSAPHTQTHTELGTGSTATATLPAAPTGAVLAWCVKYDTGASLTPEAGWTEFGEAGPSAKPILLNGMWRSDAADQTPSWTGANSDQWGILAVEVDEGVAGPSGTASVTGVGAVTASGVVGNPQFARPSADLHVDAGWVNEAAAATNLFESINEATASDTDFVRSPSDPAASVYVCQLTAVTDPASSADHHLRYRYDREDVSGAATINLVVELRQGYVSEGTPGTLIASATHNGVADAYADGTLTLSTAEADAITDYADLAVRLVATQA